MKPIVTLRRLPRRSKPANPDMLVNYLAKRIELDCMDILDDTNKLAQQVGSFWIRDKRNVWDLHPDASAEEAITSAIRIVRWRRANNKLKHYVSPSTEFKLN